MCDFEMKTYHKVEYDYNIESRLFEKSKDQHDVRELKRRVFPISVETPMIEIKNLRSCLRITGKNNGKETNYAPGYPLKSDPSFYVSKFQTTIKSKEIIYWCLFHPLLVGIDLKLTLYIFDRTEVDDLLNWESLDKSLLLQCAEFFITSLKQDK